MTITVTHVKCACADCICVIDPAQGVQSEGRIYCDETCASHHRDEAGCHHAGCACHG